MDAAIIGSNCRIGFFRIGVYLPIWDEYLDSLKARFGDTAFDVTRRKLVLGSRDSTTGWRDVSYTDSTIEMVIADRSTTQINLPAGAYVRLDALGMTADVVLEGDQTKNVSNEYYEVKAIRKVKDPPDNFVRRDCDLVKLPLYRE